MAPTATLLDTAAADQATPATATDQAAAEAEPAEIDIFDRQPTPMSELPDPHAAVTQIAQAIVDVLFGRRALTQLNAWATPEVLDQLRLAQCVMASRPASQRMAWRSPRVISARVTTPAAGVIEASATVVATPRSRALALRLEGLDGRWRCTAIRAG